MQSILSSKRNQINLIFLQSFDVTNCVILSEAGFVIQVSMAVHTVNCERVPPILLHVKLLS